ncbi:hypothetical protein BDD43_1528 [Mucilaginibacter gracilis]|uniref:Outer membrane protein with beta-barrel domain n=1 Tax=Mucilaginibacter gracilis TaxID=423350 RepID=A0A495IXT5_9SPHI|nr:hypothetical protein [Mucilaginibacter gracilis]RKR81382.1 hypothetical protein BDD43_1528 [Mucilaginibacter gracilis]
MKKAILVLIALPALVFTAKAQLGYNFAQYSLGAGYSYVSPTTDVPYPAHGPAVNFNITFNSTPYTNFSIVYEFGQLTGGYSNFYTDAVKNLDSKNSSYATVIAALPAAYEATVDPYRRYFTNNYQSISLHGDVQLGEFLDYENGGFLNKVLRNVYVGTGIGMIYNNIVQINRYNNDSTRVYGVIDKSNNVFIPVRLGYQFKIYNAYDEPFILVETGYQMNYVFGYGLDGYADPDFTSRNFERFGGFHIGLKFNFGNVTSYRKPIH